MGGGPYSEQKRSVRATNLGYTDMSRSVHETFKQRMIHDLMIPTNVIRESRDSEEHPLSLPVIIALDVTRSMGDIPKMFIAHGLPTMMSKIFAAGIADPQLLLMAIGDHLKDDAPLQVGQFESSDELIDKWLSLIYVEDGGGGNGGESYSLAWAFAAGQTVHDSWEKRNEKGFLFTIGDEPVHQFIHPQYMKEITGNGDLNGDVDFLLAAAMKTYHVYHLHITSTMMGASLRVQNGWKNMMGEHVIMVDDYRNIPSIIAEIVASVHKSDSYHIKNTSEEFSTSQSENNSEKKSDFNPDEFI